MAQLSLRTEDASPIVQATKDRIEPRDGGLHGHRVDPVAWLLANQLSAASRGAGLQTVQGPTLRLSPSLLRVPDVAVGRFGRGAAVNHAAEVTLIAEVTSPGVDADSRAAHYAKAGINWYLLAEPDFTSHPTLTLRLLHRDGTAYTRHTTARHGQTLTSRQPFPLTVSTTALLDF
jgi:Uma2 family endonuclease